MIGAHLHAEGLCTSSRFLAAVNAAEGRRWVSSPKDARVTRESDKVVGALRLGNAGGAKDPDFWCAFEDGEVEVIGDEPENTINDRTRPRLLCRKAKESHLLHKCRVRLVTLRIDDLANLLDRNDLDDFADLIAHGALTSSEGANIWATALTHIAAARSNTE